LSSAIFSAYCSRGVALADSHFCQSFRRHVRAAGASEHNNTSTTMGAAYPIPNLSIVQSVKTLRERYFRQLPTNCGSLYLLVSLMQRTVSNYVPARAADFSPPGLGVNSLICLVHGGEMGYKDRTSVALWSTLSPGHPETVWGQGISRV